MSNAHSHRRHRQFGPHIYQRKPGGNWYAYTAEFPKGRSLATSDRDVAERKFRDMLAAPVVARKTPGANANEVTIDLLGTEYIAAPHGWTRRTKETNEDRMTAFIVWCDKRGIVYPGELSAAALDEWKTERAKSVSRRTLNRDLRVVRRAFAWAAERGLCAPHAAVASAKGMKEARRTAIRYVPDASECARAFAALERLHVELPGYASMTPAQREAVERTHRGAAAAVRCLYATGLRIDELRRLTAFDVRDGAVHVRPEAGAALTAEPTKGYRERTIPVAPAVVALVHEFLSWRSGKGGKGKRVGCSESWLLRKLAAACKAADVHRFTLHELRAAFATDAFDSGVGLKVIQGWLGHADPQTTQGYIRARRSDARVVAPMPRGLFGAVADSVQTRGADSGALVNTGSGAAPEKAP
jgi:integrase